MGAGAAEHLVGGKGRIVMAKRILIILIRAKAEKQIPFIRATSASAPPNDYLKKILFFELKKNLSKTLKISQLVIMIQSGLRVQHVT